MNKFPKLAIEVDGNQYHSGNPRQEARDRLKDSILKKAGIDVLRLSTKGSMESEKIKAAIDKVLNAALG